MCSYQCQYEWYYLFSLMVLFSARCVFGCRDVHIFTMILLFFLLLLYDQKRLTCILKGRSILLISMFVTFVCKRNMLILCLLISAGWFKNLCAVSLAWQFEIPLREGYGVAMSPEKTSRPLRKFGTVGAVDDDVYVSYGEARRLFWAMDIYSMGSLGCDCEKVSDSKLVCSIVYWILHIFQCSMCC